MNARKFPFGAERAAVYAFLRSFGFVMSDWSDKVWTRADGKKVHVFGAGSMARFDGKEFPLGELAEHL